MTASRLDPDAWASLCDRVRQETERAGCAAQIAVARGGGPPQVASFGRCRRPDGSEGPADDATLFSIFSVTKALVASAAWILLQERKLALADRVAEHVPEFGSHGKQAVTVEHLLEHTAGFPNAALPNRDWPDPARRLARLASWRLEWEPGSRFVYHGTSGMWALAEVIGRVAGMDYRDFLRARVLEPLGLSGLWIGLPEAEEPRVAQVVFVGEAPSREQRAASPVDAPPIGEETLGHATLRESRAVGSPGGGAIAGAADVARFYQALLADAAGRGPGVWQPEMLREAWRVRRPELVDPMTGQPALRGLGVVTAGEQGRFWRGFAETCSPRAFGHMGAGGQISWADPETGLCFVYLTSGAERDPVRQGALGLQLSSLAAACAS